MRYFSQEPMQKISNSGKTVFGGGGGGVTKLALKINDKVMGQP